MKQAVLFICHRIPYPPNKGEKIAAFNILKYLNEHYDVHLGYFIDNPDDAQYVKTLDSYCVSQFHHNLDRRISLLRGVSALISQKPVTLPYYFRPGFQKSVDATIDKYDIQKVVLFSGAMAQYFFSQKRNLHSVMHFVDIDSDKWRQYSDSKEGLAKWFYRRECRLLQRYEIDIASKADVSCFVTPSEVDTFKRLLPSTLQQRVKVLENGLDNQFFDPDTHSTLHENYPLSKDNYLVFTGAMDYWANVDAVTWFVRNVWPEVKNQVTDAKFYIVGGGASKAVQELANTSGVVVTNRVVDVRPYLEHAKAVVAPMQIARGVQNKILEAMAMAKPIYTTELGMEGITNYPSEHTLVSNDAMEASQWCTHHLNQHSFLAAQSRQWIKDNYSWPAKLASLKDYLDETRVM